jgi:hypothetical protein
MTCCEHAVGRRFFAGHLGGFGQRDEIELPPAQNSERAMSDDRPEPAWERRRIAQLGQRRPDSNECVLGDIFGKLEIMQQRECRAECQVLKAARQRDERLHVALACSPNEVHEVHRSFPTA